jgi:hypothetical protein
MAMIKGEREICPMDTRNTATVLADVSSGDLFLYIVVHHKNCNTSP